jgi:RNA polymerase sigma-70 factor (ECF subfamily)
VGISTDHDQALMERIADGDRVALRELYSRHGQGLSTYLRLFTNDHGQIEEIVQDTMLAAWTGADRFAGRSTTRSWLFGIARRRAMDTLRRRRLPVADAQLETLADPAPSPEAWALAQASQGDLLATIERLSPVHQEILLLTFVHELAYSEIAEMLEVPIGTVKSRLSNARRALRAHLRTELP